ncbi:hypothetical protein R1flu_009109 [Riccia fluitans]|uniref:Protein kinase domain-containing protein n=1 Tax=Riccia fluitans TaxID=41844 RepID=A0ABD1Z5A3_9MARC
MVLITVIKHKNLLQLKGFCVRDRRRLLVYEYAENNTLADALWGLQRTSGLNWVQRDIKAQNIFLDKSWEAKIGDFGLVLPVKEKSTSAVNLLATQNGGTLGYFAPEYATAGIVTEKLDAFSYGILVLEILAGRTCIDHSLSDDKISPKNWVGRSIN